VSLGENLVTQVCGCYNPNVELVSQSHMEAQVKSTMVKSKIAELRQHAGLTQLKLSQDAGVTENTVQNWEKGRAGLEQIVRVLKFCEALNCQVEDLIEVESKPEPSSASSQGATGSWFDETQKAMGTDKSVKASDFPKPKIAELRQKARLTQLELSRRAEVTENTVQNWESGRLGIVQIERVLGFCRALNCKVEDLIEYVSVAESRFETTDSVADTNLSSCNELDMKKTAKMGSSYRKKSSNTVS
jgi:DNA-binding Xre family transcriptional regulator